MHRRQRKAWVLELLAHPQWQERLPELLAVPGEQVLGGLFAALLSPEVQVRWHAVTAFGLVVAAIAERELERARIVMRRLLWSLNDESGGIGWGAPEAMAEIMVQSPRLAQEYANHLRAFIHEAEGDYPDCYLEHAPLRRGALWGLGRLAEIRPEYVREAGPDIVRELRDPDGPLRGYAAWTVGLLRLAEAQPDLERLCGDRTRLEIYRNRVLSTTTVAALAHEAHTALSPAST